MSLSPWEHFHVKPLLKSLKKAANKLIRIDDEIHKRKRRLPTITKDLDRDRARQVIVRYMKERDQVERRMYKLRLEIEEHLGRPLTANWD